MRKVYFMKATIFILTLAVAFLQYSPSFGELTVNANHDHIKVDFDYSGSTVGVSGYSDPGVDLVVTVSSPEAHQMLNRKGRTAGFLWMNTGKVAFEHLPAFYFVRGTRELASLLAPEEMEANGIGYEAILEKADIEPAAGDEWKQLLSEFIKFKEGSKLYSTSAGGFELSEEGGRQKYRTVFDWPYQASPGQYGVAVYAVKDGRVQEKAEIAIVVERVGIVEKLTRMAQKNGALYGILSISIAIGAGFGVGMIFRKSGGAH